jgi:hypothetical protein
LEHQKWGIILPDKDRTGVPAGIASSGGLIFLLFLSGTVFGPPESLFYACRNKAVESLISKERLISRE